MMKASDKTGAADAMVRLQQVYNISVDDLASGSIKGYQGRPLTVPEMGEVGAMWTIARDHKKALEWFELALTQSGTSLSSADSRWLIETANSYYLVSVMMLSWYGNAFHFIGPLWWESTWQLSTNCPVIRSFDIFSGFSQNKLLNSLVGVDLRQYDYIYIYVCVCVCRHCN